MKLWVARNRFGKLFIYQEEPIYEFCIDEWLSDFHRLPLETFDFPEVTFENSPQEVEPKLVNVKEGKTIDLQKAFIEKACEWLNDTDFDMEYWNSENGFSKEEFIEDFKKAMEE